MRKIYLSALMVFITGFAMAQSFGIKGGLSFTTLSGDDADAFKGYTSFHIGVLKEFILLQNVSLQPELLFSTQGAAIKGEDEDYKLNYFTLPVLVKVYLNDDFSIHAGPQFGLLAGETKHVTDIDSKTFDISAAAGIEYALSESFFVQARYCRGINSITDDADIKNSVVQLSIGFLF
jgi:opacity protein-like surface antigen